MKLIKTNIAGVVLLKPGVFGDARGFFMETWNRRSFAELDLDADFVQDNHSRSAHGTLRGLHYQTESVQGKLVRVTSGCIYDVAVDIRRGSPTFGQWCGEILTADNHRQLYIPEGFGHGFVVMGDTPAAVLYKCTELYDPASEAGFRWDDPAVGIDWPRLDPILNQRDADLPPLDGMSELPSFEV